MKKAIFVVLVLMLVICVSTAATAVDSPVQPTPKATYIAVITPVPHPEVTPMPGVVSDEIGLAQEEAVPSVLINTTTKERIRPGIEIHLFDAEDENGNGALQSVVPSEDVTYLEYDEKGLLSEEEQEKFTEYSEIAASTASENGTNLTNFFWIDIPDEYKDILRNKESYTDENGNHVEDGEYLKLTITKPGTNITCTVNNKDMDVIDNKNGTVTLKLTETGAVAVFAEEVDSSALNLTAKSSVPDIVPDAYIELLNDDTPAVALCDNRMGEEQTAIAAMDINLLPVEYISLLDPDDQARFLQAYEDVRDTETDQTLRHFFWLDIPYHYAQMLSDDPEEGRYLRLIFNIPGENPVVTVNGQKMRLELIEDNTYAVMLTATGPVAVYSDPTEEELTAADDGSWYRG